MGDLVHRIVLRVGGALTPCVSWGWRGLKKNVAHPPVRIISGTALNLYGPSDGAAWEMQRLANTRRNTGVSTLYILCFGPHMLSHLTKSETMNGASSPQRGIEKKVKKGTYIRVQVLL